jgi:hypothetical protein
MKGIEEQELIGQDEEDSLLLMGINEQSNVAERCTECSKVKKKTTEVSLVI